VAVVVRFAVGLRLRRVGDVERVRGRGSRLLRTTLVVDRRRGLRGRTTGAVHFELQFSRCGEHRAPRILLLLEAGGGLCHEERVSHGWEQLPFASCDVASA